jgi:Fe/S biogenesis protein NfuA
MGHALNVAPPQPIADNVRSVSAVEAPAQEPTKISPFAAGGLAAGAAGAAAVPLSEPIIEMTPEALAKLIELRADEPEAERMGLRLEIISSPGQDFRYDLSFDIVTKAAFTDEVRTHDGLKVIIPAKDMENLKGATLDYAEATGLILRNPNKPVSMRPEGLIHDDAVSAEIEAIITGEVNPALAAHGGFVTFAGHDGEGTAYMTMGGGCHGCSMSRMTMLEGVQTTIVEQVESIHKVADITDHSTGDNPFYS